MGQYKRRLKDGLRFFYSGQYKGVKYFSQAIYLNKTDCAKAEREKLKEIETRIKRPIGKMTLYELCTKRLDLLETKSRSYYLNNRRLFRKILALWGNDTPVENVTKQMIHNYLLSEVKRFKLIKKDNYSANCEIRYLKALFNWAIDDLEVLEINPAKKLKFYGVDKKLKYIPPDEHINMVCECVLPHERNLLIFCIDSGCRISEALRATGDDIQEKRLVLWTRKKRYSDLTPRFLDLPSRIAGMKKTGRLFPEWNNRTYPRFIRNICKELGIPVFGFHSFRHRLASLMASKGERLINISYFLGHESLVITQQYLRILGYNL